MKTHKRAELEDVPDKLMSIVAGLRYLQSEASELGMAHPARLLKIATDDIIAWAKNSYFVDEESDEFLKLLVADSSIYHAFAFLAKFALLDDQTVKKDVMDYISSVEERRRKTGGIQ